LVDHPAVLNDPEPAVLADSLGRSTVNLRIYFWINAREYSWLKVCSSVIRLVKRAFQEHGISMPDEDREVVFPQGIPVTMLEGRPAEAHAAAQGKRLSAEARHQELDVVPTKAEAGLFSDAIVIEKQARQAQPLKEDENLLPGAAASVLVGPYTGGVREQAATLVSQIAFNRVLLHGMLAFLLFAGSIQVSLEELAREWLPVALLAIFGTVVSTCIVGGVTWLVLGWLGLGIPFLHSLLFGALISPTDPIAGCWES